MSQSAQQCGSSLCPDHDTRSATNCNKYKNAGDIYQQLKIKKCPSKGRRISLRCSNINCGKLLDKRKSPFLVSNGEKGGGVPVCDVCAKKLANAESIFTPKGFIKGGTGEKIITYSTSELATRDKL